MKITLGKEKVVAIGPRMEDSYWGQWQFPKLMEGKDGRVVLTFHNGDDVWEELGAADVWAVSDDRGETWNGVKDHTTIQKGVLLPRGQFHDIWKQRWSVYHMDELPDGLFDHLKEWPMLRTPSGQTEERAEWSTLDWENRGLLMMFPTSRNVAIPAMPNFIGKLKVGPDGKLWAATYNKGLNPRNGAFSPYSSTFVLCSEDEGHSWKMQGYLPYIPDNDEYEYAFMTGGWDEPDLAFAPDGSMIMILRITDVFHGDKEWAPSYITRSTDQGKTWSKPVRFDDVGVMPRTCQMGDAILAIYGRPGIYVRGTTDPAGMVWDAPVEVMTGEDRSGLMNEPPVRPNFHQWAGSCCNCDIHALDEKHAIIAYSDFYHLCEDGVRRKSIKTRIVTIEK